eukprot:GFUD01019911.1.p1 GENE.GFUD01019911.1~~GFUD01019911.1.p1  ORF type:complete len:240 (-),score=51.76 GFUD01019911.1:310-939(-)
MASDIGEQLVLRLNNFEKSIGGIFTELRENEDFFDVTLVCDDNQVRAHKIILSSCSSFFKSILRRNPHQHPLLYLKGVKFDQIIAILNFMYSGEVSVGHAELNSFLLVAEDLKVNGLSQNILNKQHQNKWSDKTKLSSTSCSANNSNKPANQHLKSDQDEAGEENTGDQTGEQLNCDQIKAEPNELDPLTERKDDFDDLSQGIFGWVIV